MPKKPQGELITARHFRWILTQRGGVFCADGRSNKIQVGRHSLGTKEKDLALAALTKLDEAMARKHGILPAAPSGSEEFPPLPLEKGRKIYEAHYSRARAVGGISPASAKRYRAILDKYIAFAESNGIGTWNDVTTKLVRDYATHLETRGFKRRSIYTEVTTVKQCVKCLVDEERLPPASRLKLSMPKPRGTSTYCFTAAQVSAIVEHCRKSDSLHWLGDVILGLAVSGMRISELAALRWSDVKGQMLHLRTTKGSRERTVPIRQELAEVLERLPRSPDGLVFHGPRKGRIKPDTVRNSLIRNVLKPLAERFPTPRGEKGFEHGRLHSFRHYFISTCAAQGIPTKVIERWVGHRGGETLDLYTHLHDDESKSLMGRLRFAHEAELQKDQITDGTIET